MPAQFLVMMTWQVLGMGLPCTPAGIIAVTIGGPALIAMGCELCPSHQKPLMWRFAD